jgi:undecaprenyl-diphosphatase
VLLAALFSLLTLSGYQGKTRTLDLAIMQAMTAHIGVALILLTPCLALLILGRRSTGALVLVASSAVGAALLNAAIKVAIRRPTPGTDVPQSLDASKPLARIFAPFGSWYSFLSGRTVGAIVSFGLFAYVVGQSRPRVARTLIELLAAVGVALLGLSRIALGRHYPNDVLGGLLGGGA